MKSSIDWDELHRRLEAANATLAKAGAPSAIEDERILHERAIALAQPSDAGASPGSTLEAVEFVLAGERYGIRLGRVREVCALTNLTAVPCTPAFLLGIINLRGDLHAILDLARFLDLPDTGITDLNTVIILDDPTMRLGILAESIRGVRTVALEELKTPEPPLTGLRSDCIRGATRDGLLVLDVAKLLADERILVSEAVAD